MIMEACTCNWGIEGVESLPEHHHYQHPRQTINTPDLRSYVLEDRINVWVDWKQVARELGRLAGNHNPWAHMDGGW